MPHPPLGRPSTAAALHRQPSISRGPADPPLLRPLLSPTPPRLTRRPPFATFRRLPQVPVFVEQLGEYRQYMQAFAAMGE